MFQLQNMGAFAKFKCFFVSFVLFYTVYLYTYRCPKTHESSLDHAVQVLTHPFSHQHDQLCQKLDTVDHYVAPYRAKAHAFLDSHVHSHHLFKEYKVESKLQLAKAKYYELVHPWTLQFAALIELAEYHAAVYFHSFYVCAKAHFHKTVVPKAGELKKNVAAQAETVAEQVASQASTLKDQVVSQAATLKDQAASQAATIKDQVVSQAGNVKEQVIAQAENIKEKVQSNI